jgi:hypothetical protein
VAVAAGSADYLLQSGASKPIPGSGGAYHDVDFMFSPTFPSGGRYSPVLLSAADNSSGLPVIQTCNATYQCTGATTLAGSSTFSIPVSLVPSTQFSADGTVFARAGTGIYKSTDGGTTFAPLTVGQTNASKTSIPSMVLAPGYAEHGSVRTAYAAVLQIFGLGTSHGTSSGGIYRSEDGGTTWSRLGSPSPLDTGATVVAVAPDGRLFGGYIAPSSQSAGLLCSTDGTTWTASCPATRTDAQSGGSASSHGASNPGGQTGAQSTPGAGTSGGGATPGAAGGVGSAGNGSGGQAPAAASTGGGAGGSPLKYVALALALVFVGAAVASQLLRRRRQDPTEAPPQPVD